MRAYSLKHIGDAMLLRALTSLVAQDRETTASLLAHIAEVDLRRLYVPAGHPSMFSYCVEVLHLSEDAAYKRIQAARTARRFPMIFDAVAKGRLHLAGICLLAPHLTAENVESLLEAAFHKSKAQIEKLLAERFPKPDVPTRLRAIGIRSQVIAENHELAPGQVENAEGAGEPAPGQVDGTMSPHQLAPGQVDAVHTSDHAVDSFVTPALSSTAPATPRPKITPLAPRRFALQLTIDQSTHDKLRYASELLSHQIPSGDLAQILDLALEALIKGLEKRKFAATEHPQTGHRIARGKRSIPAQVKRTVWKRDGGQCTFVSRSGHRCAARSFLEFDHADPVARGGEATVKNLRLRCRAHNQYEAECVFGAGFMETRRDAARSRCKVDRAAAWRYVAGLAAIRVPPSASSSDWKGRLP